MSKFTSRRQALQFLSTSLAAVGTVDIAATRAAEPPAASAQPDGACVLFPEAVEGPYYFDPKLVRSDITEGRPGVPLSLQLRIIESGSCAPIVGARVDIWHADAGGIYSGYSGQGDARNIATKGQTYLRGTQITGAEGNVTFQSVYPGWYPGRTPHIHVKVFLDQKTLVTGQIYFPDDLSARIYASRPPYNERPAADTTNSTDWIFKSGEKEGGGIVFAASEEAGKVAAALLIAVDRTGAAAKKSGGWRGWLRGLTGRE